MRLLLTSLYILIVSSFCFSQELNPVAWSININHQGGNNYEMTFESKIDEGWTVYSQFTSDDGPVPTEITFESEGIEKVGESTEKGHKKEGPDALFDGVNVIKFLADEPFLITQNVRITEGTGNITGYLTYMTCDHERCLPPTDVDFSFDLSTIAKKDYPSQSAGDSRADNKRQEVKEKLAVAKEEVKSTASAIIPAKKEEKIEEEKPAAILDLGEIKEPVKWSFKMVDAGNGEYDLNYTADIADTWNVYSQYTSDDGPVPTEIVYEIQKGVELIGKATETGHKKEGPDPLFDGVTVIKFLDDEPFEITQRIKADKNSKLKGYLTFMTCDDGHCLPPTDVEFEANFATGYFGYPKSASKSMTSPVGINVVGDKVDQRISTIRESFANPVEDCGGEEQADTSLWTSFILGFLGGLVALLTPCVFPMIPLTVSYFTKDTKRSGVANGIIYGLSIIVIYVAMGLILTAVFGEEALNGLSTNWIANTIFFLIFLFFAFSFFGYYEITLPSSWSTKTDSIADKGGLLGIFFMAFTLALVSFSCTGPIIGAAIVGAASNAVGPGVVMFGFSLALALPFGFFAAFPSWLNSLPRSGGWMNSVKVILGFLELAFAFKFLSVADMTSHWGIVRYELFLGIWVLIAGLMGLYLFGKLKFPHDSPIKKLSPIRTVLGIGSFALMIYLATGFIVDKNNPASYVPKAITSGIAPPANYNFFLKDVELDKDIKKKYISYTKCANDIPCFKDYYDGLNYAKEVNKPVFLDFTGFGCVNCRKTEEFIWVDPTVKSRLVNDYVLVSLYVDDRKKLKDQYTSVRKNPQGDNVKLRTVGNKWADFQIVNFEQNSQPLYVMMTNEEEVVSNPRGYHTDVNEYIDYLNCGLSTIEDME